VSVPKTAHTGSSRRSQRTGSPVPVPAAAAASRERGGEPRLPCRIQLADGRVVSRELPAARHRAIHLRMLHAGSEGFVEITPGTRPPGGAVQIDRRKRPEHFLGAAAGDPRWLERSLEHCERILAGAYTQTRFGSAQEPREECFLGVTSRTNRSANKEVVAHSRWLWVDLDGPEGLDRLHAFLAERPCQLLVWSGGGVHAYWRLARPLPATRINAHTSHPDEPIEQANGRLVTHLGGDRRCRDRSRVLRVAGSPNYRRDEWARVIEANLALPAYTVEELVGDLPDDSEADWMHRPTGVADGDDDPYKRIPAAEYMARLAGRTPNRSGKVRCPVPDHPDEHPSCSVTGPNRECWQCQSCGAAGTIYDLASLVLGGPYGRGRLHGEAFKAARKLVIDTFGAL